MGGASRAAAIGARRLSAAPSARFCLCLFTTPPRRRILLAQSGFRKLSVSMRVELVMTLMPGLVFYSWQSDLPNTTNRGFIERALVAAAKALKNDDSLQVEPVIDRDTAGVPGSPNIAQTIFKKIDQATVFVGDISIINRDIRHQATTARLTSNPNVLLELGHALKALGDEQVILVLNEAYGGPELLPFDLRLRRSIGYHMEEGKADRASTRKDLEIALMEALRARLINADRAF